MAVKNKATNAGVEALSGFAFQRNSAIYLILDNYVSLVKNDFFVCIEHHDDVIFAHQDKSNKLTEINVYQAKKSTSTWNVNSKFAEIIAKLTNVGSAIKEDEHVKSDNYTHKLHFLSNKSIKLSCGKRGKGAVSHNVKENDVQINYQNLHSKIQSNILTQLNSHRYTPEELSNVGFLYVDMGNVDKSQQNQLSGMLGELFKGQITDPQAALDLMLSLFRKAETIYNQGDLSQLLDRSKRISGKEILRALNVITTRSKTFKFWREHAKEIVKELKIPISKSSRYEEYINNSFDFFKDLQEVEHRKIFNFVNDNRQVDNYCIDYSECISELHKEFFNKHQTQLNTEIVLFAIVAAFVETREG